AYVAPGQVLFTWTPGACASQYRVEVQSLASPEKGGGLWKTVAGQIVQGVRVVFDASPKTAFRLRVGAGDGPLSAWESFHTGE
ncbi:MAG: hypothetical protein NTW86_16205, partial [Candidatus Sumerlaeota bacterium]|nr:hypothetical protein [Candidatus Sumerlaeota bacterium]